MEILSAFSIADLLAYLFPGILSLSGIYMILSLTPIRYFLQLPQDIGESLAFLVLSYITGVLVSAITDVVYRENPKSTRRRQNKGAIQFHDEKLKAAVVVAFNDLILDQKESTSKKVNQSPQMTEWNEDHYYVCRSLVTELMPRAGASGIREGAYRQLRMNLIGSIVIWGIAGLLWGFVLLSQPTITHEINGNKILIDKAWAWILVFISIFVSGYLTSKLRQLMDKHEQREVREILTTFLAGYKTGIFNKGER